MIRRFFQVIVLLAAPSLAAAHSAPFSYLDLVVRDAGIDGTLVLHIEDAAHDLGVAPATRLLEPAFVASQRDALVGLLATRISLRADDRPLTIWWLDAVPAPDRQGVRVRFHIETSRPGALGLKSLMFPYDPVHQTFVNLYDDNELRQQMIFNAASGDQVYYTGTTQGAIAVMRVFIPSGIHHILIGPDHILFLIGLLLLGGTWRSLLTIVTAFTVGHSLTLSLAALNLVTPSPRMIEPAIALSIIFVGVDNLVRGSGRDLRAWAALVFGLVHGFGFAAVLREFGLPSEALGWSLLSFNAGVEMGQLVIVLLVATMLALIRRRSPEMGRRVAYAGSVVVSLAGGYWFVQRVFFP